LAWGPPVLGNFPAGFSCTLDTNTPGQVNLIAQLPAPPAPTNFVAAPSNSAVRLSWSSVATATGYNVKRALVSHGSYAVLAPNVTSTNYSDAAVTNSVTYYYVVSALNGGGESANSAEVAAMPAPSLTPVTLAFQMGSNPLRLSWPADHTGWRLQIQTNAADLGLSTNWTAVAGSQQTNQAFIPIDSANGAVFLRLTYP
jgi:hypothetical protein